ncbi:MAG: hypothetical protein NZ571_12250, partial [Anaerolineae bacterium]|nr:hypothetical protein [Anaerolineae bacterium]
FFPLSLQFALAYDTLKIASGNAKLFTRSRRRTLPDLVHAALQLYQWREASNCFQLAKRMKQ